MTPLAQRTWQTYADTICLDLLSGHIGLDAQAGVVDRQHGRHFERQPLDKRFQARRLNIWLTGVLGLVT